MPDEILASLLESGLERVREQEPLRRHTSWRIGGPADYFGVAENHDALRKAIAVARRHDIPFIVLGGGSNILVSDRGVDGLVILNRIKGIAVDETDQRHAVAAGGGAFFAQVALFTARRNFTGLEWGVAIPGTVGAAVVNNAGAHGGDVQSSLVRAQALDPEGMELNLWPHDLNFSYRHTELKGGRGPIKGTGVVITRVWFEIAPAIDKDPMATIEELMSLRQIRQPITNRSAGSTFTNPAGESAGELLERCGLKGKRIGGAEISAKHANFIINREGASAGDVIDLIRLAQEEVSRRLGIVLEPEVQLVGRWSESELRAGSS